MKRRGRERPKLSPGEVAAKDGYNAAIAGIPRRVGLATIDMYKTHWIIGYDEGRREREQKQPD